MASRQITDIIVLSKTLSENARSLLEQLSQLKDDTGKAFNVNATVLSTTSTPVNWLGRIVTMDEIVQKFDSGKQNYMVPETRLTILKSSLETTNKSFISLQNNFFQVLNISGGLRQFNYDNFHATTKNGQAHNCLPWFKAVDDTIDPLMDAFFNVLMILRPTKATYSFQAASNALNEMISKTHALYESYRNKEDELTKGLNTAKQTEKKFEEIAKELNRLRDEGASDRKTITEYASDASDKVASISTAHNEAMELQAIVQEYDSKFQSFDRQINSRENAFSEGTQKIQELIAKFEEQRESIAALVEQSEEMLKGATVAGLAGRFEQIRNDLTGELISARRTFYLGIAFLFVSSVPLMAFVFLPILAPLLEHSIPGIVDVAKPYGANSSVSGWQYLGQVLARFIILLPAAWFVSFTAIRHSSLFRLREHYSYKYSMAVSVEGFKKQAKGYENEIAALVLEQLAFNPADKLVPSKDVKEGKVPHPMLDFFVSKFRQNIDKLNSDGTNPA